MDNTCKPYKAPNGLYYIDLPDGSKLRLGPKDIEALETVAPAEDKAGKDDKVTDSDCDAEDEERTN